MVHLLIECLKKFPRLQALCAHTHQLLSVKHPQKNDANSTAVVKGDYPQCFVSSQEKTLARRRIQNARSQQLQSSPGPSIWPSDGQREDGRLCDTVDISLSQADACFISKYVIGHDYSCHCRWTCWRASLLWFLTLRPIGTHHGD